MCVVQEAPSTRQPNIDVIFIHRNYKQERDKLVKREGLDKAKNEFIQCLIYIQMWDSDRRWKTTGEVKK